MTERQTWIDFAKLLAILAVMVDHTNGLLYTNQMWAWLSYYSVTLFIMVNGYNNYESYKRKPFGLNKVKNKITAILIPYGVAVFIYLIMSTYSFSFEQYVNLFIHFNAADPHYYILLYISLTLVSPLLCYLIQYTNIIINIIILLTSVAISIFTTNYSNILDVYGGGGKLIGGTFIIVFILGMIFAKYNRYLDIFKRWIIILLMALIVLLVAWTRFICINRLEIDAKFPFGRGYNPPSISFTVYAIILVAVIYCTDKMLLEYQLIGIKRVCNIIARLGKHTLYIFLYHILFLYYINGILLAKIKILADLYNNIWFRRVYVFILMIAGSLLIELLLKRCAVFVKRIYTNE